MKVLRKIIEIDEERCDGCGNCVLACAEGAIEIIDGKAKVIADKYCDGLGACIGDCPQDALTIVEREAEDFDEEAVEELLKKKSGNKTEAKPSGCPSAALKTFPTEGPGNCQSANKPVLNGPSGESSLGHWPVQISLVPAGAPFLKDADLLIAADCVPVAYPNFHRDLLKGKAVMIGCPKFDDAEAYIEKLAQVFKISGIKSITSAIMEVPCCSALPVIVKKALAKAGVDIPFNEIVVSARGEILS
ncbi:ATP-binding protein [Desulfospira joergensenii]|uniref:ATP-binding protein n=1 Tax=Desulfospira joergensenii TaxID=53329 RepID=UPI0003B3806A|nr:4Fe-4S binding protein [Desulfospira joergensenii]